MNKDRNISIKNVEKKNHGFLMQLFHADDTQLAHHSCFIEEREVDLIVIVRVKPEPDARFS